MGIDVEELRKRIAKVRAGVADVAAPRVSARSRPVAVFGSSTRGDLVHRLYRVRVLGYGVRILTAVFNFPKILGNLQWHYAAHANDVTRIHATIDELRLQLDEAVRTARDAVNETGRLQSQLDQMEKRHTALMDEIRAGGRPASVAGQTLQIDEVRVSPADTYRTVMGNQARQEAIVQVGGPSDRTASLTAHKLDARFVRWPDRNKFANGAIVKELDRSLSQISQKIGIILVAEDLGRLPLNEASDTLRAMAKHLEDDGCMVVECGSHGAGNASPGKDGALDDKASEVVRQLAKAGLKVERAIRFASLPPAKKGRVEAALPLSLIARKSDWPLERGSL